MKSKQVVINSAKQFAEYGNSIVSVINGIYIEDECMVSKIDESDSKPVPLEHYLLDVLNELFRMVTIPLISTNPHLWMNHKLNHFMA